MKKILAAAIVLAVCGIICVAGAFVAVGGEVSKLSLHETEAKTYQSAQAAAVHTVRVVNFDGGVTFTPAEEMRVEYKDSKYYRYDVSEQDGVLTVTCDRPRMMRFSFGFFDFNLSKVMVFMPPTVQNVNVVNRNGSVSIYDFSLETLNIETTNASLRAGRTSVKEEAKFITKNGSLRLNDFTAGSLEVQTSNASLSLLRVESKREIYARSSNGSLRFEDIRALKLAADTTNAGVKVFNAAVSDLSVTTTDGSVNVDNIESERIKLKTTNASIKGKVKGKREEYTLTISTTNASQNVESGGNGPRLLEARTTNGSIKIAFLG